jgi:DNA-binding response OmpR family regulator
MPSSTLNVLFVDDDSTVSLLASSIVQSAGFKVFGAMSGTQARKVLATETIHLIVTDMMMPEEDGVALCQSLRKSGCKLPILFLSAVGHPEAIRKAMAAGANDYLVKPFDMNQLIEKLRKMLKVSPLKPKKPVSTTRTIRSWLGL